MGEYFMDYLGTDSAKQELSAGLMKMIDTKGVEEQISAAIGTYMQSAFSSYGNTLSQALGTQISKANGADDDTDRRWYGKSHDGRR